MSTYLGFAVACMDSRRRKTISTVSCFIEKVGR